MSIVIYPPVLLPASEGIVSLGRRSSASSFGVRPCLQVEFELPRTLYGSPVLFRCQYAGAPVYEDWRYELRDSTNAHCVVTSDVVVPEAGSAARAHLDEKKNAYWEVVDGGEDRVRCRMVCFPCSFLMSTPGSWMELSVGELKSCPMSWNTNEGCDFGEVRKKLGWMRDNGFVPFDAPTEELEEKLKLSQVEARVGGG